MPKYRSDFFFKVFSFNGKGHFAWIQKTGEEFVCVLYCLTIELKIENLT